MDDIIPIMTSELDVGDLEQMTYEDQVFCILHSKIKRDLRSLGIMAKVKFKHKDYYTHVTIKFNSQEDLNYYRLSGNLKETRYEYGTVSTVLISDTQYNCYKGMIGFICG